MTEEQKRELERKINYYSYKSTLCKSLKDTHLAILYEGRMSAVIEALLILGYEAQKYTYNEFGGVVYDMYKIVEKN